MKMSSTHQWGMVLIHGWPRWWGKLWHRSAFNEQQRHPATVKARTQASLGQKMPKGQGEKVQTSTERNFINTEAIVIGLLFGGILVAIDGPLAWMRGAGPMIHAPIPETALVALWLAAVVAYSGFKLPTFFADTQRWINRLSRITPRFSDKDSKFHKTIAWILPRLAIATLLYLCGQISWFFDSFAVVLLLRGIDFEELKAGKKRFSLRFSVFMLLVIGAFNALTAGGCLFVGELWGLPYFLSSGMANPLAGLPLAIVLVPYTLMTSTIGALLFPVKIKPVPFDGKQIKGGLIFAFFLTMYIFTHRILLSMGAFLLFVSASGRIHPMIKGLLHELEEGAFAAICLILVALCISSGIPGATEWIGASVTGWKIGLLSTISSPFAGAMIPGAQSYQEFYENLSWIMLGAPAFVSSSLVALIVFRNTIDVEDLPKVLQGIPGISRGPYIQEAVGYTLAVTPMIIGLLVCLWYGNSSGLFVQLGERLMGAWPG